MCPAFSVLARKECQPAQPQRARPPGRTTARQGLSPTDRSHDRRSARRELARLSVRSRGFPLHQSARREPARQGPLPRSLRQARVGQGRAGQGQAGLNWTGTGRDRRGGNGLDRTDGTEPDRTGLGWTPIKQDRAGPARNQSNPNTAKLAPAVQNRMPTATTRKARTKKSGPHVHRHTARQGSRLRPIRSAQRSCTGRTGSPDDYFQRSRGYLPSAIIFSMAAIRAGLSSL